MARPSGVSNIEWRTDVPRREVVTVDRRNRLIAKRLLQPWGYAPSPGYSDGNAHGSFNPNIIFPHGAPQRSSPSGFNPDPHTPSPAFNASLNTQYSYSLSTYSSASPMPPLRRGALPFIPGLAPEFSHTDADKDEIITSGSVAAVSCLRFGVQDETMDTAVDMDDELDDDKEGEDGEEEQAEAEPEPAPKARKKKKIWHADRRLDRRTVAC
ncbi:hypothetical protein D1007_03533 [Hordeum vulgare]|nr:hypothetical protein D1007_03533 [Hordeum vulgare]